MERKTKKVLGYSVDLLTFNDAVQKVIHNIYNSIGMQIVTINPEMIELANNNCEYSQILNNAELVIPDGSGIKLALKLKGIIQEQIPGIDFSKKLIEESAKNGYKIAMIGSKEDVITKAANNLKNEYTKLNICYTRNGYFDTDYENTIINDIYECKPQLIFVALGAPKQEFFIKKCRQKYNNAVYIGVGGSFDVWAGNVERAPELFRKIGCEWLYRTLKQPNRIKRIYKTLPMFLIKAIIEAKLKRI